MREKFLKKSIASVKKKYPYYTEEKLEEIEYGLDAIYLNIPKTLIIFGLAIILGIFKDMILLLTFYGILRTFAFGMHASKSWHCLVISTVMFIGGGLVCKYISIPYYVKIIISILSLICIIKYAPADTHKRPLINAKRRKLYKIVSSITAIIYVVLIIIFVNKDISIYLTMGILEAVLMIHPITYKVFQMPYANYKHYNSSYN